MSLASAGLVEIPGSTGSHFDHGAFDPKSRRVFVAHTARDCVEVIDHDTARHLTTLTGFPEAAGVVADQGQVLITNRGAASLARLDGGTAKVLGVFDTAPRPNGVALVVHLGLAIVACIGDESRGPELQVVELEGQRRWSVNLPGRPRWCVMDADGARVFLAIRDPSMIFVARLPRLDEVQHWKVPAMGAHGLDIDRQGHLLYAACDEGVLVELDARAGAVRNSWPLSGGPDATFFNPASGLVHVAIADPGLIETIDPRNGTSEQFTTGFGAKTTALVPPDRLYVFSPLHRGAVVLAEA